jgi:3-hydroxymyristoyl/3-hydroxydecanoyl-(acyl carrier protein) dehydratase
MSEVGDEVCVELHIERDHPAFAGHFPGAPVLPGALLAALVFEALRDAPQLARRLGAVPQIEQLKLLSPVGPGAALRIHLQARGDGVVFDVQREDTRVAHGRLAAAGGA